MSDNKNSFLYTNYLMISNFITNASVYLYNTLTTSTYYNFAKSKLMSLKNRVFPPKVVDDGLHVDSTNQNIFTVESTTKNVESTPLIDTDVKLDNE